MFNSSKKARETNHDLYSLGTPIVIRKIVANINGTIISVCSIESFFDPKNAQRRQTFHSPDIPQQNYTYALVNGVATESGRVFLDFFDHFVLDAGDQVLDVLIDETLKF